MKKVEIKIDGDTAREFWITSGSQVDDESLKFSLLLKQACSSEEMKNDQTHVRYVELVASKLGISPNLMWNVSVLNKNVLRAMASAAYVWMANTRETRRAASERFRYSHANFSRIMNGQRAYFSPNDRETPEMIAAREAWAEL